MKWIVITPPDFINHEAEFINQLFEQGIDLLHLRKPNSNIGNCEKLIEGIEEKWHQQIVVHDHFELCEKYHLHGIHLNKRNHDIPQDFLGSLSRSCHSIKEIKDAIRAENGAPIGTKTAPAFDYVFLSPIFDSISKEGYSHAFTNKELEDAAQAGIINDKVIALGGISLPYLPQLRAWNFGGAAFLGDIWNKRHDANWAEYLISIRKSLPTTSATNTLRCSKVW